MFLCPSADGHVSIHPELLKEMYHDPGPDISPVQRMYPQLRKLLEVSYEAWMDSGISHAALQGSDKVTSGNPAT